MGIWLVVLCFRVRPNSDCWVHHRHEHVGFSTSFFPLNVKKKSKLYIIPSLCAEIGPIYSIFLLH